MCQLLGMNSLKPARLDFSLAGFLRRGGETDEHADGWGVAYFTEQGCELLIDETASATSATAQQFQQAHCPARNVLVHIRKATQGAVSRQNCHPFVRRLWGRDWAFAHNGNLERDKLAAPQLFQPSGETDSEQAFCLICDALVQHFGDSSPTHDALHSVLSETADRIAQAGTFNFMLSNGEILFARCATELHYVQRAYPFGRARLLDCEREIEFAQHNHLDDRMIIIATRPLTDEAWQAIPQGRLMAFAQGEALAP
ncbi:MAG: class II glutamine amidotransferase [Rhodocyclaceae bacterium]